MSFTSPELVQLESLQAWMATLTVWQEWIDSVDATVLKSRIVWPLAAAPALPVCVLSPGRSVLRNLTGSAAGANFQPAGQIKIWVYAADTHPNDLQTGYSTFLDLFSRLRSDMAEHAHMAPVLFDEFEFGDPPVIRSNWINTQDEETDEGLSDYWHGEMTLRWGIDR
jgi:hypothetical protein